jgi:hypothetical protein
MAQKEPNIRTEELLIPMDKRNLELVVEKNRKFIYGNMDNGWELPNLAKRI